MLNQQCFLIIFRAFGARIFAASLFEIMTSIYAIIAYVIILAAIMIALVLTILAKDDAPLTVQLKTDDVNNFPLNAKELREDEELWSKPMSALEDSAIIKSEGANDEGERAYEAKPTNSEASGEKRRFYKLCAIDEAMKDAEAEKFEEDITLSELCDRFRNFAANRMGLYYDISNIRRFISGLGVSRIMILQGISGTGKTSLPYAFGKFLNNSTAVISVQPMWKERTDLIGYYNEFTKRFNETTLLEKMYEANYREDMFITILDEMNIARIEYYFAEFLSQLELPNPEERFLDVVTDKWQTDPVALINGKIKLPVNMWFIGTANNDDSTFSISDKVYDRAMVINLDFKAEPFYAPKTEGVRISARTFERLIEEARREYSLTRRNYKRLERLSGLLYKYFKIGFGNRIWKQIMYYIPIYIACGGDELEALDDILARKVMRKLEMQNTVYLKNSAEPFCEELEDLFGEGKMPLCKEYVAFLVGSR